MYSAYVNIQAEETNLKVIWPDKCMTYPDIETTEIEYANLGKEIFKFAKFEKELLATH